MSEKLFIHNENDICKIKILFCHVLFKFSTNSTVFVRNAQMLTTEGKYGISLL